MSPPGDHDLQQRMQRVEGLLQEIERFPDPRVRDTAREVVQLLMDLHGAGLARLLELTAQQGTAGRALISTFAGDELVASLLLLYDLHPQDLPTRIRAALDTVTPRLRSHKAEVELVHLADGVVQLRLTRAGAGEATGQIVEEAIHAVAPDVVSLHIEGMHDPSEAGRMPLPILGVRL